MYYSIKKDYTQHSRSKKRELHQYSDEVSLVSELLRVTRSLAESNKISQQLRVKFPSQYIHQDY